LKGKDVVEVDTRPTNVKQVQRIWPSAADALAQIIAIEGGKASDVVSQLIIDYRDGMGFTAWTDPSDTTERK
jgi:hypothetical protein